MKRTTYLIILLTAVMAAPVLAGQIIYVDTYAAGNDAGSSWTNAYNHLQDALSAAAHGDEIRVANGVYKPDLGIGITPGERTASFQLKPGVVIEGGYAGSGSPDPNARNIELYKTVLSGDLDNDDDPNFANNIENSYHVVTGSDTYADSVLDGFTISGGNADASGDDRGGGMYNYLGSPKVINCTFTGNSAIWGGGVHNDNSSRPLLINCRFVANSTDYQGAGMYNRAESSPLLLKCLFYRNTSGTNGGAIFNRDDSHPAIINCTLVQNESDSGAGIHNYNSNPLIINSIIWGNSDIGGSDESAQIQGGVPEINYSCIQGWTGALSGIGNTGSDPCFADSDNNDYHLKSQAGRWEPNNVSWVIDGNTSPCIDAGDPDSNWTEQLWPHGMHTNMGAFGGDRQASMSLSNAGNIADLNIDGFVNYEDLKLFSNKWLRREVLLSEDLDRNAVVSLADFAILADHWGWQGQGYEQFYSTATSELRRLVNEEYSYYNLRGVDWEDLFITYSDVLNNAEDPDVFAQHAAGLLANAQDMHLWVKVGEQHSLVFKRSIERNYNFDILPTLFPNWLDKNDRVSTGYIINGNIGYIWIDSWSVENPEELDAVFEALNTFSNTNGLIIDVRANSGGGEGLAGQVAGCFVTQPKLYAKHRFRDIAEPDGFGPVLNRRLYPNSSQPTYTGPVAVLMGEACMSSCDAFLLMMKQVPGCTLMGVKSYGSSGNTQPHEIGNGVTVYLPSWLALRPDETCFEGEGIFPHITVEATQEQLLTEDPVLRAAVNILRGP